METSALSPAPESKAALPLLPPFLLSPAVFLWLWALPIGLLLLLDAQGYWLVGGNLSDGQRDRALTLGGALAVNFLVGLALFGLTRWYERKPGATSAAHLFWALPAIVVQAAYLWLVVNWIDQLLPASVTAWIYPPERFLFNQFAFAMLPLFLGILRLACTRPATGIGTVIAANLGLALAAPLLLYLLFELISAFHSRGDGAAIVVAVCAVILGIIMFLGLVRCLLFCLRAARTSGETGERIAILVFALVLPVAGLLLNRRIPFPVDFQAWEVYALVGANTAFLLLASWRHRAWPRASFCLLCVTLPFSLYFFIVFLPYTPLSIVAVIALGMGFLVLTPTFLFVLHLHLLNASWRGTTAGRGRLLLAGLGCGLLLPAYFTVRSLADRAALNAALDYVYSPSVAPGDSTYPGSRFNLGRALHSHRSYKNGIYYPLLSDFYSWLVFDNLVLPDDKLDRLELTFFGIAGTRENLDLVRNQAGFWGHRSVRDRARLPRAVRPTRTAVARDLQVRVQPADGRASVVTLALTLANPGPGQAEYRQRLPLPPGTFVTGFRLQVNGALVPGRIVEKKTALWVYTMIRDSERRDPGLLFYNAPDELELCVFPVVSERPTMVEMDFLVPVVVPRAGGPAASPSPVEALAQLGRLLEPQLTSAGRDHVAAGGLDELQLPAADREPYLHVIVDRSADNGFNRDLSAALRTLQQRFPAARGARITLANYDVVDLTARLTPLGELAGNRALAGELAHALPLAGGFAADLALAHALRQHRDLDLDPPSPAAGQPLPPRPIFVILSRASMARLPDLPVAEAWADMVPGLEIWELGAVGGPTVQRRAKTDAAPLLRLGSSVRPLVAGRAVRFETAAAADARLEFWSPERSAWQAVPGVIRQEAGTPWAQAVGLHLRQQDRARMPGNGGVDWPALVQASRTSGVLLASTSYIVVENPAQWKMLEVSERQKLGQNAALDFKETPAPPALWLVLGFVLWIGFRRWKKSRGWQAA